MSDSDSDCGFVVREGFSRSSINTGKRTNAKKTSAQGKETNNRREDTTPSQPAERRITMTQYFTEIIERANMAKKDAEEQKEKQFREGWFGTRGLIYDNLRPASAVAAAALGWKYCPGDGMVDKLFCAGVTAGTGWIVGGLVKNVLRACYYK